jgi:hypothetical protein
MMPRMITVVHRKATMKLAQVDADLARMSRS